MRRKQCGTCGELFNPRGRTHKYCSPRCSPHNATLTDRFFRRYPHRMRMCEARGCTESRVVDLAHKRPVRGANRTTGNTRDEDVWVLCPTHHRLLDAGHARPEDLDLDP